MSDCRLWELYLNKTSNRIEPASHLVCLLIWRWSSIICLIISSGLVHLSTSGTSVTYSIFPTSILHSRPQHYATWKPPLTGGERSTSNPPPIPPPYPTPAAPTEFCNIMALSVPLIVYCFSKFPFVSFLRVLGESLKPVFWLNGSKIW